VAWRGWGWTVTRPAPGHSRGTDSRKQTTGSRDHRTQPVKEAFVDLGTWFPDNEEGPTKTYGGRLRYRPDYPYCGRVKYHWPLLRQTTYAAETFGDAPDIVKSHEWFGSGGSASRQVLISQKVGRLIIDHKLRGLSLVPVALRESE